MSIRIRKWIVVMVAVGFVLACLPAQGIAYGESQPPGKVQEMTLKVTGQPQAKVSWKRVDGAAGYKIYRNGKAIGKVEENEGITQDTLYYNDETLQPGESYTYAVKAYVLDGDKCVYGGSSAARKIVDGYTYEVQDDGEMTLTGYSGRDAKLDVPSELAGAPVTEIGDECFRGNVRIKGATVPEGVTEIGDYSFEACSLMKKVFLPESLKTIGDGAFSGCGQLSIVDLQDGVTKIGSGAFLYCTSITSFAMPDSLEEMGSFAFAGCEGIASINLSTTKLTSLPDRAFYACDSLKTVKFPAGLKTIGKRAFSKCSLLGEISFPVGLETIGDYAFEHCASASFEYEQDESTYERSSPDLGFGVFALYPEQKDWDNRSSLLLMPAMKLGEGVFAYSSFAGLQLEDQEVETPNWTIIDGSLYSADKKTLLAYFPAVFDWDNWELERTAEAEKETFTVPAGVTRIAPYAFTNCGLKSVTLPASIREIPANAFKDSDLTKAAVKIPQDANVTIDENAFDPVKQEDSSADDGQDDGGEEPADDGERSDDDIDYTDYEYVDEMESESLAGDKNLYREEDYQGYLDIDNDDAFAQWLEKYIEFNKDNVPMTAEAMPYITMYTGEEHYRQMTSVLNHDAYKTKVSIEMSGDDYAEMYLMMDHGLFAELARGRMNNDLVLYSGITTERVSDLAGVDRQTTPTTQQLIDAIGTTTHDQAIMSTTGRIRTALNFGSYAKAIVIIYASQEALDELGTICVDEFSIFSGEHEVLFNTNAPYKILDVGKTRNKTYYIEPGTGKIIPEGEGEDYTYVKLKLLTEQEAKKEALDGTETLAEPTYEWAEDHSSVKATVVCSDDGDVLTETAETTYEVVQKPTADKPGVGRYTAKFKSSAFDTQYFDIELTLTPEQIEAAEAAKEGLQDTILQAKNVDASKYTSESFQALQDAVAAANEVFDDPTALAEDVKVAKANLLAAWRTLEPIDMTAEAEKKAQNDAVNALAETLIDIYENLDTSAFKPASVEALQKQIDAAEAVLADEASDTETLRAAKTDLLKARKSLEKRTSIAGAKVSGLSAVTFANKAYKPVPAVTLSGSKLTSGTDYTVSYKSNKNAGTAKVVITGKGDYIGTATGTFQIRKAAQKMTAKAVKKSLKAKKVKKAKKTVSGAIKVKNAKGKVTYSKAGGSAKLTINKKTGKITVKKGTKKGTYSIKVKVKAAGNKNYKALTKKVTVKVTVK